MSKKSFVKKLTDLIVDSNLRQLVTGEREILTEIIIYIREVDCRRNFRKLWIEGKSIAV